MTTAAASDSGSDCEHDHWPDDATHLESAAVTAPGYDSHNGLRSRTYQPAPSIKAPSSPKIVPAPAPQLIYYYHPPAPTYPPPQYTYAAAAPPGFTYPVQQLCYPYAPQLVAAVSQIADYHVYHPASAAVPALPGQGNPWVGRTRAEVEEDNSKIAKKEGANAKRKVVPVGVKDEQMVWCVEVDGSNTLRTFVSTKEFKGEWQKDPRPEVESWFFVREAEEARKKD
ncbi:hypothetical protein LTR53_003378 [Teratosphaeriaceae sp. CCFEE 6253]|nr:hypothetical protein LTR53_003378 [Teratosphaeriaceae sp. CCFEE 6253]